jgi:hypothetical protein
MKRTYRLYWLENSVGYWPSNRKTGKIPTTDILLDKNCVPHGAVVRVHEVLARDPERSVARYCSAMLQQSAILIRHEVTSSQPDGREWTDAQRAEVHAWASALGAECDRNAENWNLYGGSTFDPMPYVEVEVEVEDDDIEDVPEDDDLVDQEETVEKLFEDKLRSMERVNKSTPPAAKE